MQDDARIIHADCRAAIIDLLMEGVQVDSIVTDPPYALTSIVKRFGGENAAPAKFGSDGRYQRASAGFMGKKWDTGEVAHDPAFWSLCFEVLKPGGHILAFGGTRTSHRMVCAIEDAGFEIRDQIAWLYGSGFPKSLDVSKAIDNAAGVEREDKFEGSFARRAGPTGNKRCEKCGKWLVSGSPCKCPRPQDAPVTDAAKQWAGWGTALKPAIEPICLARKPLTGTVAENVLAHGTGAINIDGCRVGDEKRFNAAAAAANKPGGNSYVLSLTGMPQDTEGREAIGRWPANVIHDGSQEVLDCFPDAIGQIADASSSDTRKTQNVYGEMKRGNGREGEASADRRYTENGSTNFSAKPGARRKDAGTAARFFYCAKANKTERAGSKHPTVKPLALMRYLCRLVTPPGGLILDPFAGSGTTLQAALEEGFRCIAIEREDEYLPDIERRLAKTQERLRAEILA